VLRLWPSRYAILEAGHLHPLYLGSVVHEDILRPMGEFSGPKTDIETPAPTDNPAHLLPGSVTRTRADGTEVVLGFDFGPVPLPPSDINTTDKSGANPRAR
jgi:undecaprenyl-diphosphatase